LLVILIFYFTSAKPHRYIRLNNEKEKEISL